MKNLIIEGISFDYDVYEGSCYIGLVNRVEDKKEGQDVYSAMNKFENIINAGWYNLDVMEGKNDWRVGMYMKAGYEVIRITSGGWVTMGKGEYKE